jgi:hypothetical protein
VYRKLLGFDHHAWEMREEMRKILIGMLEASIDIHRLSLNRTDGTKKEDGAENGQVAVEFVTHSSFLAFVLSLSTYAATTQRPPMANNFIFFLRPSADHDREAGNQGRKELVAAT